MTSLWENNRKIQVPRLYVNILTELISYPRAQNSNIHIKNHPADDITMGKQQKNTSPQIECEYFNYFMSLYRIHEHRIQIFIKNHPADDITMGKQQKNTSPQIVCEYFN